MDMGSGVFLIPCFFEMGSGEKPGFGEGTNQRSNPDIEIRSTKQIQNPKFE
jgi:hypothetical protein